jgi:DNA-binding phage protein
MSWTELGRRAQLSRAQLARLGDRYGNPRLVVADRVAAALGVPVESIWRLVETRRDAR